MNEITGPCSRRALKIDETGYADILTWVCGGEFEHEFYVYLGAAGNEKRNMVELKTTGGVV